MNSLPMTALEVELDTTPSTESELICNLFTEIRNLRESNRVILDVFRSVSGLAKTCNKETICQLLKETVQSLETNLKESDSCP